MLKQEVFRVMDDFTQTTNIWQGARTHKEVEPHVTKSINYLTAGREALTD